MKRADSRRWPARRLIKIVYRPAKCELEISGHADYAPKGYDIVCAGISALAAAVYETLGNTAGFGASDFGDFCVLTFDAECGGDRFIEAIFACAANGMKAISAAYPEHAEYKEEY